MLKKTSAYFQDGDQDGAGDEDDAEAGRGVLGELEVLQGKHNHKIWIN